MRGSVFRMLDVSGLMPLVLAGCGASLRDPHVMRGRVDLVAAFVDKPTDFYGRHPDGPVACNDLAISGGGLGRGFRLSPGYRI